MIFCLGTTPAEQRVMVFRQLTLDAVNRASLTLDGAAGKSINVAKVLQALGERPVAAGFFGGDRGRFLRSLLEARGIELEFVEVSARTRQCITVIDESSGMHTELVEEAQPVSASDYEQLRAIVSRRLPHCRAVVLSGSITPGCPADLYRQCVELAHHAGVLSVVDAQGVPLTEALKARPGLVKPNRSELAATVGAELKDAAAVRAAMSELCRRGAGRVVVTAGKGPVLAFDGSSFWNIVPPAITARNPTGSGDAFTAGLVWRLLRGENLGESCRWASAAGAANALTLLPGEIERADVERLVTQVRLEQMSAA